MISAPLAFEKADPAFCCIEVFVGTDQLFHLQDSWARLRHHVGHPYLQRNRMYSSTYFTREIDSDR